MAAGTSVINVAILGDARKFKKAIGEAQDKLGKFTSGVGTAAGNIAKGIGFIGGAAGGLAVVAGAELFKTGEELISLDQKIGTVFSGQSLDKVTGWADEVAARMGLTATQAAGLAANAGDLLKPMGFTADEAANIATEVVGLSGALSEWSGGQRSVEETAEILQKALLGERDSLKTLGISINQAEVDQKAMAVAMADGRDEITAMDKALATQELILEKSTDAQEAYAEGGNNLTEAQNKLKAAVGEVKETMARKLLPVFARGAEVAVQLIDVFNEQGLGGVIRNLAERFREAWPQIKEQLETWGRAFVEWIQEVGPKFLVAFGEFLVSFNRWWYGTAVPRILKQLGEWTRAFLDWAKEVAPPLISRLGDLIAQFANWFSSEGLNMIVTKLAEWAAAFLEWIGPMIPPALRELGKLLASIAEWMVNTGLPNLIDNLLEWRSAFIDWVVEVAPGLLRALGGLVGDIGRWIVTDGLQLLFDLGKTLGSGLIDGLIDALGATISGLGTVAKAVVNAIIGLINTQVIDRINNFLEFSIMGVTVNPEDIPHITKLAEGGIVTSPTLALIGEGNESEAVIPLSRLSDFGGGGMNVTVNMPPGSDGADVVAALQRYARAHGGTVPILTGQL